MKAMLAILATVVGGWLIINLIGAFLVGLIARAMFPAKDKVGWPMTILLGFLGGVLGKLVFRILGWPTGIVMGFVASIAGAFVLLFVHHMMVMNKTKPAAA
jgi:uncharacterized membrane protein YeaQ/YmgE (transglycosylase-associated protein family)